MRKHGLKKTLFRVVLAILMLASLNGWPLGRADEQKKIAPPVFRVHPVPARHGIDDSSPWRPDSKARQSKVLFQLPGEVKNPPDAGDGIRFFTQDATAAAANYRLVYTRTTIDQDPVDKDLFIIGESGSGRTLLTRSADREYFEGEASGRIIYSVMKEGYQLDIYSITKSGTGIVPLATDPEEELVIAIAGSRVIYAKNFNPDTMGGDFYSVTYDGNDRRLLAQGVHYGDVIGEWLVYEREIDPNNHDLYSVKTDGSLTTVLAAASETELYAGSFGSWVIFHRVYISGNVDLYATPADGSNDRPVCLAASPRCDVFAGVGLERIYYNQTIDDVENYCLKSVRINGSGTIPITSSYMDIVRFGQEYGNRVVVRRCVENGGLYLCSVKTTGGGEIRLTNSLMEVTFLGMLGSWVVYKDGFGDQYKAYGVNVMGGSPVLLSDWLTPEAYEWVEIDPVSQKVIISKLRNSQIDLTSVMANGTQRTRFTSNSYRDFYCFSTANCYIYSSLVNNQWDLYSYNFRTRRTRVLANSSSYHESVPNFGGGPVQ